MAEIKRVNGQAVIDYMARDYDSMLRSMRAQIPQKLPEWDDYESEADFGNVLLQLFAHMGDILSYYQDRIANESFLGTAQTRRSIIHHLRLIGYTLATAAPAATILTLYVPADYNERLIISKGDAFATKSEKDRPSIRFEYTRETPLLIDCNVLDIDPDTGMKQYGQLEPASDRSFVKGVPVEEGRLVRSEVLGTSNGSANQRFTLVHAGLILRSLGDSQALHKDIVLLTRFEGEIEEWQLRESLAFSHEGQREFAVEIDEDDRATILFGNGVLGAIPTQGSRITATYRVGGGRHGNVRANTITTIADASQLTLNGAMVTNLRPATGGAERESIEHAVGHAPLAFRSGGRAVSGMDYEALARDFKGVGKVRAEAANWNTVRLFIAPEDGGHINDVLRANLLAYFEDKRPVTTLVEIKDVDYVEIYVTAEIGVKSYYNRADVEELVQKAAGNLLAFQEADFAQTIYLSKFYEAIEAVSGLDYVIITEFRSQVQDEDVEMPNANGELASGKIVLGSNQIPVIPEKAHYATGIRLVEPEGKVT